MAVHYLGQEVLRYPIQGSDVRITYLPNSVVPPAPVALKDRFPRIPLPEPPSTLPPGQELQALNTLLPFMEKGVLLTSTAQGVYGKRFCQGRVFWTGPHTTSPGLHKMERNMKPQLLFSKEIFKQREWRLKGDVTCRKIQSRLRTSDRFCFSPPELDQFRSNGGEPPHCGITLCFGEELSNAEDPASKLIIVQVKIFKPSVNLSRKSNLQDLKSSSGGNYGCDLPSVYHQSGTIQPQSRFLGN